MWQSFSNFVIHKLVETVFPLHNSLSAIKELNSICHVNIWTRVLIFFFLLTILNVCIIVTILSMTTSLLLTYSLFPCRRAFIWVSTAQSDSAKKTVKTLFSFRTINCFPSSQFIFFFFFFIILLFFFKMSKDTSAINGTRTRVFKNLPKMVILLNLMKL